MCGIAGFIAAAVNEAVDARQAVRKMLTEMSHRGPDDEGIYDDESRRCVMAHARLSVIDVTMGGHQPMSTSDGRYTIVFNGEIYNYRELRRELETQGHRFRTQSDTEVLLESFALWGAECVGRLRGMFAFAVWDSRKGMLTLVRDRFGIKPLYYAVGGPGLWFASEVRTLLASGHVPRLIDRHAVADYLAYGSFQQPHTIIDSVKSLLPGHIASVCEGSVTTRAYWSAWDHLSDAPSTTTDYGNAAATLREKLEEATRLHMIADVPVGAFLSGGIDSRLVVGLMSKVARVPIKTFTVAFEQGPGSADERGLAARTAADFGCAHAEIILAPSTFAEDLEGFLQAMDCPSIDGFNTYVVARAARNTVTVVLSGLGGDELFAGYPHFARIAKISRWFPRGSWPLRTLAQTLAGRVPGRIAMPLLQMGLDLPGRLRSLRCIQHSKGSNIGDRAVAGLPFDEPSGVISRSHADVINVISAHELTHYLPNTLLRDGDTMSMRHGLELRPLLLDNVLAEHVLALPGSVKYRRSRTKAILIESCRDLLPSYITDSPKLGFETPVRAWASMITGRRVAEALVHGQDVGLLSAAYVTDTVKRIQAAASLHLRDWAAFIMSDYIGRHRITLAA